MHWNSGHILYALTRYFDWRKNIVFSEYQVDGGIADLVLITKHLYLTEIEIKISVSDWNADLHKGKFDRERPHVSRFFYAIPDTLEQRIPSWVSPDCGIIGVHADKWRGVQAYEIRPALRRRSTPLSQAHLDRMYRNLYYRFWDLEQDRRRRVLFDNPKMRQNAGLA